MNLPTVCLEKRGEYLVPVIAVEDSGNRKLGRVSATYVSQGSCPLDCPFLHYGCYAETGRAAIHTRRLNRSPIKDPIALARAEARAIDNLTGKRLLRLHVVGDCRTNRAARIVASASARYAARMQALAVNRINAYCALPGRKSVWTYCHAWRKVARDSWGEVSVLASVESFPDAHRAISRGYAPAIVVPRFRRPQAYPQGGLTILPCPHQSKSEHITCDKCRLCLDDNRLLRNRMAIAFLPHGEGKRRVERRVEQRIALTVL